MMMLIKANFILHGVANIPSPHDDAPPDLLTSPLLPTDFERDLTSSPEGDDGLESNSGVHVLST